MIETRQLDHLGRLDALERIPCSWRIGGGAHLGVETAIDRQDRRSRGAENRGGVMRQEKPLPGRGDASDQSVRLAGLDQLVLDAAREERLGAGARRLR